MYLGYPVLLHLLFKLKCKSLSTIAASQLQTLKNFFSTNPSKIMKSQAAIFLLGISLTLCHVRSHTTGCNQLKIAGSGLLMMQEVESASFCPEDCDEIEFSLSQKVLCFVYNRYVDYTIRLLSTPPDSSRFATYTTNQFVALKSLNNTCNWVNLDTTTNNTLSACTIPEIRQMCSLYRVHEIRNEIYPKVNASECFRCEESRNKKSDWLQLNLTPEPESIVSTLLSLTGCEKNSEGGFASCY